MHFLTFIFGCAGNDYIWGFAPLRETSSMTSRIRHARHQRQKRFHNAENPVEKSAARFSVKSSSSPRHGTITEQTE
jgi:hypothetical protein